MIFPADADLIRETVRESSVDRIYNSQPSRKPKPA
jgi:hypothetical protein